jgi:hypothetical protein
LNGRGLRKGSDLRQTAQGVDGKGVAEGWGEGEVISEFLGGKLRLLLAEGPIERCICVETVLDGTAAAGEYLVLGFNFLDAAGEGGAFDAIFMGLRADVLEVIVIGTSAHVAISLFGFGLGYELHMRGRTISLFSPLYSLIRRWCSSLNRSEFSI